HPPPTESHPLSLHDALPICFAGADPDYRIPIRIVTETAWHSLFARNLFIQANQEELARHVPEFTVIQAPNFHATPEEDGTNSERSEEHTSELQSRENLVCRL